MFNPMSVAGPSPGKPKVESHPACLPFLRYFRRLVDQDDPPIPIPITGVATKIFPTANI